MGLAETHIFEDVAQDGDKGVFSTWKYVLMESTIRCAGSNEQAEETFPEAETRKVSQLDA